MPAEWTGDLVGKMHVHRVSQSELARQMNKTRQYVGLVLNGQRAPKKAEQQFTQALEAILRERGSIAKAGKVNHSEREGARNE